MYSTNVFTLSAKSILCWLPLLITECFTWQYFLTPVFTIHFLQSLSLSLCKPHPHCNSQDIILFFGWRRLLPMEDRYAINIYVFQMIWNLFFYFLSNSSIILLLWEVTIVLNCSQRNPGYYFTLHHHKTRQMEKNKDI